MACGRIDRARADCCDRRSCRRCRAAFRPRCSGSAPASRRWPPDVADGVGAAQRSDGGARRGLPSAIAAGPSPASSCCPTAATRAPADVPPAAGGCAGVPDRASARPTVGRDREVLSVTAAEAVLDRFAASISPCRRSATATAPRRSSCGCSRTAGRSRSAAPRRRPTDAGARSVPRHAERAARLPSTPWRSRRRPASWCPENNTRSVLVQPPARPRRVLLVQGAPGLRAQLPAARLERRPGLEVDSVVRKGKNEQGGDTFYIQAARRAATVARRPDIRRPRDELFAYDAIVLANVEGSVADGARSSRRRAISSAGAAAACSCSARSRSSATG